jgi:glycosyltransferase involved in cell wall biosynthesis
VKIAILGTRGIPNNYGGFEQFAEFISVGLVQKGHEVTVYNPHFHSYNSNEFKGVKIIKIKSAEEKIGAAGNFLYDYNCLKDAGQRNFDIIYEAGYATCSPFFHLLNGSKAKLITNMDGLEWMRSKWGFFAKRLMKYLESLAVKRSHYLISDNPGIQQYYKKKFNKDSFLIPYGADLSQHPDKKDLEGFKVLPGNYFMLISRMEPENNIDVILQAYKQSERREAFLIIGNYETKYGRFLFKKYNNDQIRFLGSLYDKKILDSLRFYCKAYLHGHSVGGTNPSLLEAMASSAFIIAHKNPFNSSVLKSNALYFDTIENLRQLYSNVEEKLCLYKETFTNNNADQININYRWQSIIDQHEEIFYNIVYEKIAL